MSYLPETLEIQLVEYVDPSIDDVIQQLRGIAEGPDAAIPIAQAREALMRGCNMSRYTAWRNLLIADGLGRAVLDTDSRTIRLVS